MKRSSTRPYLWMLTGSFIFSIMGVLTHALGTRCDWQLIALARSSLAFLFAALLAMAAGAKLVVWRPRTLWVRSLAGSISLLCTFYALTHLPVSDVLTLTNMFPVWVAFLSWPLLGEPPSLRAWIAVVSGVIGVVLIQQPHFAEGNFASLMALAASFATAIAMLGLHRLQGVDVRAIVVHFSGVSCFLCLAAYGVFRHGRLSESTWDGITFAMLLGVGLTATIGQIFLTKAFAAGAPAKVSVVGLTQAVFALGFDLLFWPQPFDAQRLVGIGLVLAPTAWLLTHPA